MSETFEKVLIKDDRIGCITPQVKFGVFKGGQNVTAMPFKAISQTTSAHVFNVPVPSGDCHQPRGSLDEQGHSEDHGGEQAQ